MRKDSISHLRLRQALIVYHNCIFEFRKVQQLQTKEVVITVASAALSGIEFPNSNDDLKGYAINHLRKDEIKYADEVLDILDHIPSRG